MIRLVGHCVATLQDQAGSWYLCRWENIHGAVGMSGMPLFMGGQATHAASCVSICMSHVVAPAPQHGTHHGTCSLACVSSSLSPAGSPYLFKYYRGTRLARCQKLYNNIILRMRAYFTLWEHFIRPSLKALRTLVIRRLQGYGNTASLSYPDTRMRKPDCLHLPYRHQPGASAVPSTSYLITQRDGF